MRNARSRELIPRDAHAVVAVPLLQTDVSEGNHEGNWDVQQQGDSQEHLGAEARVQTLSAHRGRRGDADHLVPQGSGIPSPALTWKSHSIRFTSPQVTRKCFLPQVPRVWSVFDSNLTVFILCNTELLNQHDHC